MRWVQVDEGQRLRGSLRPRIRHGLGERGQRRKQLPDDALGGRQVGLDRRDRRTVQGEHVAAGRIRREERQLAADDLSATARQG